MDFSISNHSAFIINLIEGFLIDIEGQKIPLSPSMTNNGNGWGDATFFTAYNNNESSISPITISLFYYQYSEQKFYSTNIHVDDLDIDVEINKNKSQIIIGVAPYGRYALWYSNGFKQRIIRWGMEKDTVQMDSLLAENDILLSKMIDSKNPYTDTYSVSDLPPRDLFDNYMKQFTYRYLSLFEHWNEDEEKWLPYTEEEKETKPELDYIEEALYDGTHDKLHDGGLLNYHEAGKPKKLAVKWHIKKSEYTAYFWFEDEAVRAIFDRFYGLHPDTKTDFILHIDPMKNQYQLALFRYGLKEPQVIPEETYQLIVFKNKFEHFRSKNYNQPRGAWIW